METGDLWELPGDSEPTLSDLNLTEKNLKLINRIIFLQGNKMTVDGEAQLVNVTLARNTFGALGVATLHYHEDWGMFTS
jgi:hypothetical protein